MIGVKLDPLLLSEDKRKLARSLACQWHRERMKEFYIHQSKSKSTHAYLMKVEWKTLVERCVQDL
jgi:hypothetical protein